MQSVERDSAGVSVGAYLSAMWALGILGLASALTDPSADATGVLLDAKRQVVRVRRPRALDDDF